MHKANFDSIVLNDYPDTLPASPKTTRISFVIGSLGEAVTKASCLRTPFQLFTDSEGSAVCDMVFPVSFASDHHASKTAMQFLLADVGFEVWPHDSEPLTTRAHEFIGGVAFGDAHWQCDLIKEYLKEVHELGIYAGVIPDRLTLEDRLMN